MRHASAAILASALLAAACSGASDRRRQPSHACTLTLEPAADAGASTLQLRRALEQAQPDDTLCFASGTHRFDEALTLSVRGLTLRGLGEVVLDFAGQSGAGSALRLEADGIALENLAIVDPPLGAIRIAAIHGARLRRLRVAWERLPREERGAHGIRAEGASSLLVEDCELSGAAGAAIHLRRVRNLVLRRNNIWDNGAGMLLESSSDGEIYFNHLFGNGAGLLVFDLPGLPAGTRGRVLVRDNLLEENGREPADAAGSLALAPPGTGVMILAAERTEVRDNTLRDHGTAGVLVFSYEAVGEGGGVADPDYLGYASGAWIHGNAFSGNGAAPGGKLADYARLADVAWDGYGMESPELPALCIRDNGDATFRDLDLDGDGLTSLLPDHDCALEPLTPVSLD